MQRFVRTDVYPVSYTHLGLTLTQETRFPDDGKVTLRIDEAPKKQQTLAIRMPEWACLLYTSRCV